ncbi:MAG: TetR/AcrR family transcriptional regulator [Acidimicrobiales bacterium]|nr:TetR/AcrR family transcriptional regulator [Acidimicrobiales bacterium]
MTVDQSEPANGRQDQAAATRRLLLDAAGAVFETRGYRATTVGAITDRAKTAHGTFYLYFRNKEDVFCRVIESVVLDEVAVSAFVPHDDAPRAAMEAGIRNFLTVFERHGGLWRALLEGMMQSPRIQQLWLDLRRDLVLRMSGIFEAQQRAGSVRSFDPTMVAHALAAMAEWSAFTYLVLGEPSPEDDRDPEALVATLADLWFRAVYGTVPDDGGGRDAGLDGATGQRSPSA